MEIFDFTTLRDDLSSKPLSHVIEKLMPIALSYGDYEGFCTLYHLSLPYDNSTKSAVNDLRNILIDNNVMNIEKILQEGVERAINLRTLDNNKVIAFSVLQIEQHIDNLEKSIQINCVPDGLHPVDLYMYSSKMNEVNSKLLLGKIDNEKILARVKAYLSARITMYSQKQEKYRKDNTMENKNVFIIHGHDEVNLLRLQKMIKEEFHLNPIVLRDLPNEGSTTIIEKFEKVAPGCCYAFALFTPDDVVRKDGYEYIQARPNVIFELGWFYARLGRGCVTILEKKDEQIEILSDLQGIMRIQFKDDVTEKYLEIQRELKACGII